jgi:hypothetical protein
VIVKCGIDECASDATRCNIGQLLSNLRWNIFLRQGEDCVRRTLESSANGHSRFSRSAGKIKSVDLLLKNAPRRMQLTADRPLERDVHRAHARGPSKGSARSLALKTNPSYKI